MDAIDEFFAEYPDFDYDRARSSPREFYRLCDFYGWSKDHNGNYPETRNAAQTDFRLAMTRSFNENFGTDVNSVAVWETMCGLLNIDPIPEGIQKMKESILATHVNLADMLDGQRARASTVRKFTSQQELAAYTISTGKYFPKHEAYAGGVLRFLLREILNEYEGARAANGKYSKSKKGRNKTQRGNRGGAVVHDR